MRSVATLALLTFVLSSCAGLDGFGGLGDDKQAESNRATDWYGTDGLSISISQPESVFDVVIPRDMATVLRAATGRLQVQGDGLNPDTELLIAGRVTDVNGNSEEYLLLIETEYAEALGSGRGALIADFKDINAMTVVSDNDREFGHFAGVFRGTVIAVDRQHAQSALNDMVDGTLASRLAHIMSASSAAPNVAFNETIEIKPVVALTQLSPSDCYGADVLGFTTSGTTLGVEAEAYGFPEGQTVRFDLEYIHPESAGRNWLTRGFEYSEGWAWLDMYDISDDIDTKDESETATTGYDGFARVTFPDYKTVYPAFNRDQFRTDIQIQATSGALTTWPRDYLLNVVDEGETITHRAFELCAPEDDSCRMMRQSLPQEALATIAGVERQAIEDGLWNEVWSHVNDCQGGDRIDAGYSEQCGVYLERTDSRLQYRVSTALNFELTVNGEARGGASWQGSYGSLAAAEVAAEFEGSFNLDASVQASFETTELWRDRTNLNILYNGATTQIQWWRVAQPRLRYMQVASYNQCGLTDSVQELILSDLRRSRLVLACEEVPSYDSVCHTVQPTQANAESCEGLLIPTDSEEADFCLEELDLDEDDFPRNR